MKFASFLLALVANFQWYYEREIWKSLLLSLPDPWASSQSSNRSKQDMPWLSVICDLLSLFLFAKKEHWIYSKTSTVYMSNITLFVAIYMVLYNSSCFHSCWVVPKKSLVWYSNFFCLVFCWRVQSWLRQWQVHFEVPRLWDPDYFSIVFDLLSICF